MQAESSPALIAGLARNDVMLVAVMTTGVAALGNAGLAAGLPLSWRSRLAPGETMLAPR